FMDGLIQSIDLATKACFDPDINSCGAHNMCCYQNALKNGVRISSQQVTIFECARFSFRRITYNVTDWARVIEYCLPLHAGLKSGASSASQSRFLQFSDNLLWAKSSGLEDGAWPILFEIRLVTGLR